VLGSGLGLVVDYGYADGSVERLTVTDPVAAAPKARKLRRVQT
jgi:hypothetical protein